MGAASAAYCALSAGSKPIEEVPKVIYRPGRMGPGRPGIGGSSAYLLSSSAACCVAARASTGPCSIAVIVGTYNNMRADEYRV